MFHPPLPTSLNGPPLKPTQEVRLAVVMYGGVSLACYINGVVQELYNLVRATAVDGSTPPTGAPMGIAEANLSGTQKVYRKLSQILARGKPADAPAAADPMSPIQTRFRIDILSGSSAGGINAIFLAKGLANDQRIGQLTRLWIEDGDIDVLLNDRRPRGATPASLLDSRYMYGKLLAALEGMERDGGARAESFVSPNVSELDLYITATDLHGLPLPLRLADKTVFEKRHRKVFHFVYSTAEASGRPRNDFRKDYNPFLAFAARCTSAFPFAFEPETLADLDEPVPTGLTQGNSRDTRWDVFLEEYLTADGARGEEAGSSRREATRKRAFGDGGYLDNKPFSHAIDALLLRRADVPVERKLLYIEPAPEHPEKEPASPAEVDVLENVRDALLTLPRYETIREDLQRVLQRNQIIERIAHFMSGIEEDLAQRHQKTLPTPPAWHTWGAYDLTEMIEKKGISFGAYHRLKVSALQDELAAALALAADLDPQSDYSLALRYLVKAWRDRHYVRYRDTSQTSWQTENALLVNYDLSYRLRRLMFVRGKIDALSQFDPTAQALVKLLLDWHAHKIPEGLGEPTLVRLRGAANAVAEAADIVNSEINRLTKATLLVLEDALNYFQNYLQQLTPENTELHKQAEELPVSALRASCYAVVQGRGQKEAVSAALDTLKAPLASFRENLRSRIEEAAEFKNDVAAWGTFASQWTGVGAFDGNTDFPNGFQAELSELKKELDRPFLELRHLQRDFWEPRRRSAASTSPHHGSPAVLNRRHEFRKRVRSLGLTPEQVEGILSGATEEERLAAARQLLDKPREDFDKIADFLGDCVRDVTLRAARQCMWILDSFAPPRPPRQAPAESLLTRFGRLVARACARHYYAYYDEYDLVLFPILYQTDVGEVAKVDIFRISPEDARRASTAPKLAGTVLANFGGFLDSAWRANDILWGRLDGAQRLLDVLLPGLENEELREGLLVEAQETILREELRPSDQAELSRRLADALVQASAGCALDDVLTRVVQELHEATPRNARLMAVLRLCLEDRALLDYFRARYEVYRTFDPRQTLRLLARSTQIVGQMLTGLAKRYQLRTESVAWVARVGQLFWGVVEAAVPRSFWNLFTRNFLNLLLLMGGLLLLGGILLVNREVQQFALVILTATIGFRVTLALLGQYMQGRRWFWHLLKFVLAPSLAGLAALGVFQALAISGSLSQDLSSWVQTLSWDFRLKAAAATVGIVLVIALVGAGVRKGMAWLRRRRAAPVVAAAYFRLIKTADGLAGSGDVRWLLAGCVAADRHWEWYHLRGRSDGPGWRDLELGGVVALTPDGRYLAAIEQRRLVLKNPRTQLQGIGWRRPARDWPSDGALTSVAVSPDGRGLAATAEGSGVYLWEGWNSEPKILAQDFAACRLVFSPDGRRVLAADQKGEVRAWARESGQLLATFSAPGQAPAADLTFSPDGRLFALAERGGPVRIKDLTTGLDLVPTRPLPQAVDVLALDATGRLALARGKELTLLDAESGLLLADFGTGADAVTALGFSADGRRLAACDRRGVVKLWDTAGYWPETVLTLDGGPPALHLAFSADAACLVCVGTDRRMRVWYAPGFRAGS
ncbi:MAG TPA: patatin-like protein [Gemmataceae bacterium]|jgi:patatin-related protein